MSTAIENLSPIERKTLSARALRQARVSLQQGDSRSARRFAEQAASLTPREEDPWLILAALASPRASIAYLNQALQINPSSLRARKGMAWAVDRAKTLQPPPPTRIAARTPPSTKKSAGRLPTAYKFAFTYLLLSILVMVAAASPYFPQILADISAPPYALSAVLDRFHLDLLFPQDVGFSTIATPFPIVTQRSDLVPPAVDQPLPTSVTGPIATETPFTPPTETPTFIPSPTSLPTEIPTSIPTETPLPTEAPLPTTAPTLAPPEPSATLAPTAPPTPQPTRKPKKKAAAGGSVPAAAGPGIRPSGLTLKDRWIAVDLSAQTTYAMQGDSVMHSFLVSTGRWPTITVTGVYKIYVKYRTASMSGDDYFLPNVPYVMYFYKGYGIHGTYWHNNFGTPMSHGCVNLRPQDAAWIYEFASVGTLVSVHD